MKLVIYTKEVLVEAINSGEKLVSVTYSNYDKTFYHREVKVNKITEKSLMLSGGGYARRSFNEIGELNYNSVYCLERDIDKVVENFREGMIRQYQTKIDIAQKYLEEYKSAQYKGELK